MLTLSGRTFFTVLYSLIINCSSESLNTKIAWNASILGRKTVQSELILGVFC